MTTILTPEDVLRRIAAECDYVDERGAAGIRHEPAAAIVRRYGEQFRVPPRRRQPRAPKPVPCCEPLVSCRRKIEMSPDAQSRNDTAGHAEPIASALTRCWSLANETAGWSASLPWRVEQRI